MRVGVDLQRVQDVEDALRAHGDRYRSRLFTEREIADCGGWGAEPSTSAPGLATRFAAKEAVLKVLRPGADVPGWREIEILRQSSGWCRVVLHGGAADLAADAGLTDLDVSLSRSGGFAVAAVVAA